LLKAAFVKIALLLNIQYVSLFSSSGFPVGFNPEDDQNHQRHVP